MTTGEELAQRLLEETESFVGRDLSVVRPEGDLLRGPIRDVKPSIDILVIGLDWVARKSLSTSPTRWVDTGKKKPRDTIKIGDITGVSEEGGRITFVRSSPTTDRSWHYTIHASGDNLPRPQR